MNYLKILATVACLLLGWIAWSLHQIVAESIAVSVSGMVETD
jgi:hypothetical protein